MVRLCFTSLYACQYKPSLVGPNITTLSQLNQKCKSYGCSRCDKQTARAVCRERDARTRLQCNTR